MKMYNCSGGDMCGIPCDNPAKWVNQNGVITCESHKLLLDAFTWENRSNHKWTELENKEVSNETEVLK